MKEKGTTIEFNESEFLLTGLRFVPIDEVHLALEGIHRRSGTYYELATATAPPEDGMRHFNMALDLDALGDRLASYLPPIEDAEFDALLG
jgi:hypothetical protein